MSFSLKSPHHRKLIYLHSCQLFHMYLALLCRSMLLVWFQTQCFWYSVFPVRLLIRLVHWKNSRHAKSPKWKLGKTFNQNIIFYYWQLNSDFSVSLTFPLNLSSTISRFLLLAFSFSLTHTLTQRLSHSHNHTHTHTHIHTHKHTCT